MDAAPARNKIPKAIRKPAVALMGGVTILAGLALLVLPGPGLVVLFAGLAIMATEFSWAQRSMNRLKHHGNQVKHRVMRSKA